MPDSGAPTTSPTVIVTGASRGVGLAIARRLADCGYRVLAVARFERPELTAACRALAERPGAGEIIFRPFDLSRVDMIAGFVRELKSEFGPPYGLVNNAAIGTPGLLANMRLSEIEDLVRLNTLSPLVLTKYVARSMMAERSGRIVNITSIVAATGYNGLSVYAATKSSLVGFTRSLARELGRLGITVNAVAPGFMSTEMTAAMSDSDSERVVRRSALGRLAVPEDVAESVLYLMGESGRNVTGTVLTVDAGGAA
jgi:3-oxoacyl-[acyl-carrier protein] reductase